MRIDPYVTAKGDVVINGPFQPDDAKAIVRRIIACVAALEGIPTEALDGLGALPESDRLRKLTEVVQDTYLRTRTTGGPWTF